MKKLVKLAALVGAAVMFASCASTPKAAATSTAKKADAKPAATAVAAVPEHGVIYSGDVAKNSFLLADNHTYGKNFQFLGGTGNILPGDYKAQVGDVVKIHVEGTTSKAIIAGKGDDGAPVAIWFNIVDTSAAGGYWSKLTDQYTSTTAIDAGGAFTFDITFNITKAATGKASNGCANVMVGTSNDQKEASTLTTTKFTYEITRP